MPLCLKLNCSSSKSAIQLQAKRHRESWPRFPRAMIHDASLPEAELQQFQKRSLLVGIVGLALCGAGMLFNREEFFRSYLLAYLFWIGIALGCLAIDATSPFRRRLGY